MNDLRAAGYLLPLITNQAGVGRGLMTEPHLRRVLDAFEELIGEAGTHLDGVYYCPHHPTEANGVYKQDCACRKPEPGMLIQAAKDLDIDVTRSFMVGDHWSDVLAGIAAGCRSVLLRKGHGPKEIEKLTDDELAKASYVAEDLGDATRWILSQHA